MKIPPTARLCKVAGVATVASVSAAWTVQLTAAHSAQDVVTATAAPGRHLIDGVDPTYVPGDRTHHEHGSKAPITATSARVASPRTHHGLAVSAVSAVSATGIPAAALTAYQRAETVIDSADPTCHLQWQLIAAIGRVESDHGLTGGNHLTAKGIAKPGIYGPVLDGRHGTSRIADTDGGRYDGNTSFDRAVGPMQFIPSTWAVAGVDGDGDGKRNPQDINDAALASAVYLCSSNRDLSTKHGQQVAMYSYNHTHHYVHLVMSIAQSYLDSNTGSITDILDAGYLVGPSGVSPADTGALTSSPVRSSAEANAVAALFSATQVRAEQVTGLPSASLTDTTAGDHEVDTLLPGQTGTSETTAARPLRHGSTPTTTQPATPAPQGTEPGSTPAASSTDDPTGGGEESTDPVICPTDDADGTDPTTDDPAATDPAATDPAASDPTTDAPADPSTAVDPTGSDLSTDSGDPADGTDSTADDAPADDCVDQADSTDAPTQAPTAPTAPTAADTDPTPARTTDRTPARTSTHRPGHQPGRKPGRPAGKQQHSARHESRGAQAGAVRR